MKKILLLFALVFIPMMGISQNSHIEFKGIPINGTMTEFIAKLKHEGFVLENKSEITATLKGNFVNKNCEIIIAATPKTNIVWKVVVYLPKETSWYSIESSYESFKNSFIAKYGRETKSYQFFSKPYYKGDGYEMQAVRNEKCTYLTFWELEEGIITVEISEYEQVKFSYEDAINGALYDKERSEGVMSDI